MKKTKLGLTLVTFLASSAAMAAGEASSGTGISSMTDSVDFSPALVGLMAIGAALMTFYVGSAGVRWVLRMVKGA
ncbi:hypothetical protein ACEWIT_003766 [Providencia rettgeri]